MDANTTTEVKSAAEKLKGGAGQLGKKLDSIDVGAKYDMLKNTAESAYESTTEMVKRHPFYFMLGATAVGFVAGSLISRRH